MFQNLSVVQESNESYSESPKSVHQTSSQKKLGLSDYYLNIEGDKSLCSNLKKDLKKQVTSEPQPKDFLTYRSKRKLRKPCDNKLFLKTHNSLSMKKTKNSLLALGKNKENNEDCKLKDTKLKTKIKEDLKLKIKSRSRRCSAPKIIKNNTKGESNQILKDSEYLIKIKHFTELKESQKTRLGL
jgi:hypothetical protein